MKTISIVVPCYNEEENVQAMADALRETFKKDLPAYRYEILFIDNDSKDRTKLQHRTKIGTEISDHLAEGPYLA